jgi:alpha-L-rhamnosidase
MNLKIADYAAFAGILAWGLLAGSVAAAAGIPRGEPIRDRVPELRYTLDMEGASVAPQRYPALSGLGFVGPAVKESPDPLVGYRWETIQASDGLQVYALRPVEAVADTEASFANLASALGGATDITVHGTGSIRFDFGVESAAWLEFDSPDCNGTVEMSISEYNEVPRRPEPGKTRAPVKQGNTYRLQLGGEWYDGVRFGWIHVRSLDKPWRITGVRLVCQAKPVNYQGSFSCSDPLLTRIWYTGAYGIRANLLQDYFGATLKERGDRHSWTGDAHPSQAGALVAFGNWDFIRHNLDRTSGDNNGIASYALYWVLSLVDYYRYTGDRETLVKYIDNVEKKLASADALFPDPRRLNFYGWDQRLGSGAEDTDNPESQNAFRALFIRSCREFSWALRTLGQAELSATYQRIAQQRAADLYRDPRWWERMGVHASADAVNAGLGDAEIWQKMYQHAFANRENRLSFSPFNQYFIIQAMAAMGRHAEALGAVLDCWGGQIAYGGTTYFEVFRPSWNRALGLNDMVPNGQQGFTTLSHPWGGGVTKWLTEEVAGIKPTSPGFATVDILPNFGRRLTAVAGTVPTPHGLIGMRYDLARGIGEATIPTGVVARLGVPKAGKRIRAVSVNRNTVWRDGSFRPADGLLLRQLKSIRLQHTSRVGAETDWTPFGGASDCSSSGLRVAI